MAQEGGYRMTLQPGRQRRLYVLLLLLILLQPCLDVVSYWLNALALGNSITLALRLALLVLTVLLGLRLSQRKWIYGVLCGLLLVFTVCHAAACMQVGWNNPLSDLTNLIRIYFLPLTALSFMTFLSALPDLRPQLSKGFLLCLSFIALIALIATLTGTDPHTYANKSIGVLGWFYFPNSQSAILVMLVPVSIAYCYRRRTKFWSFALVSLLGLSLLFLLGTRLAYFGLIVTGLVLSVCFFASRAKRAGVWLLILTLSAAALFPVSPMTTNQQMVAQNAVLKQEHIDDLVAQDEADGLRQGLSQEELSLKRLESAYEEYLPGLVDAFGLSRTAEKYGYSTRASDIADVRRAKITYSVMLLEDSPTLSYVFGMELDRWSYQNVSYDVENDLHGIFFLCGGAGLALLLLFFGYFIFLVLRGLIRKPGLLREPEFVALCLAAVLCAAHIYATAGVLRRPNASFYLAVCLALLWDQVRSIPPRKRA